MGQYFNNKIKLPHFTNYLIKHLNHVKYIQNAPSDRPPYSIIPAAIGSEKTSATISHQTQFKTKNELSQMLKQDSINAENR